MRSYRLEEINGALSPKLSSAPNPTAGPNDVIVAMKAASLNYRDVMVLENAYGGVGHSGAVPLSDGAGEVIAVGSEVTGLIVGDRVSSTFIPEWLDGRLEPGLSRKSLGAGGVPGILAEMVAINASGVVKLPNYLTYEEAATLPIAAVTAWNSLFESYNLRPGSRVLLLGTGGVSIFALQFAKLAGAHVTIISSNDEKLDRAKALGADNVINYVKNPNWDELVRKGTGGRGVDIALEVSGPATLPRTIASMSPGGMIAYIGGMGGKAEPPDVGSIVSNNVRIQGILVGTVAMYRRMLEAMEQHAVKPVIDRIFEFDELPAAYSYLKGRNHFAKVAIRIG